MADKEIVMALPALSNWDTTRIALHQAAQVVGAVRAAMAAPEPNWAHVGLRVLPEGLTTGVLPAIGELVLDFRTLTILYKPTNQDQVGFALAQHSQLSLADAVENTLIELGHPTTLKRDKITGDTVFDMDADAAADYARVLFLLYEILRSFRESLPGEKSRLVVWPHGFDMSFLWFASEVASEQAPHMAFGFSPYSAGLERPYLYTYAYPIPGGLTDLALPDQTSWHKVGWTGTVTLYDALIARPDPVTTIENLLRYMFTQVSPLLR
jgi:hypothetical protein